jgi:V-type H+-transporting ATPase subunit F
MVWLPTAIHPTETEVHTIEAAFSEFTQREDIAILLINQHVRIPDFSVAIQLSHLSQIAERIRHTVDKYQQAFPALLEIPSKDHPYGRYLTLIQCITPH